MAEPPKPLPPPPLEPVPSASRSTERAFGGAEAIDLDAQFPFQQPPDYSGKNEPLPLIRVSAPTPPEIDAAPPLGAPPPPPDAVTPPEGTTPPHHASAAGYGTVTSANTGVPAFGGEHALTWGDPPTQSDKQLATLAHLTNILNLLIPIPLVFPLAIYLLYKDKSKYIAYHALQATVMNALIWGLGLLTCGLFALAGMVLSWVWAMKSRDGKWEGYPMIQQIGREDSAMR